MKSVSVKRMVIFKNHIFPQVHKPLRSITEYLSLKNPDLDQIKVRKMKQILDEQQKRRIRNQTKLLNEQINVGLQKYYSKYIQPFQSCPDYYRLLFSYALKKLEWTSENESKKGERFFLTKKQIKNLIKTFTQENERKQTDSPQANNRLSKDQNMQEKPSQQNERQSMAKNKLLFEIYRLLYPSQKLQVYSLFTKLYKQFLTKQQAISQQLLETNIIHLKPFLYHSPVQLYQSKNPEFSLKESQDYLIDNQKERQKICFEFAKIAQERHREINFISEKFKVNTQDIRRPLWEQYFDSQKELSFYSLIKYRAR